MLALQSSVNNGENDPNHDQHHDHDGQDGERIRDIHALTPPHPPAVNARRRWETGSSRASSSSEVAPSENFTTMSREFNALVLAGSSIENNDSDSVHTLNNNQLTRIGEDHELQEETNPLAIVPDNGPYDRESDQPRRVGSGGLETAATAAAGSGGSSGGHGEVTVLRVKKEEVESKICAWQNAKIAKINNRFKREDAIINGWESEQVQKASSWMKKVERKLEEKRARALEKCKTTSQKHTEKQKKEGHQLSPREGPKLQKSLKLPI